jgi:hypothetical protein
MPPPPVPPPPVPPFPDSTFDEHPGSAVLATTSAAEMRNVHTSVQVVMRSDLGKQHAREQVPAADSLGTSRLTETRARVSSNRVGFPGSSSSGEPQRKAAQMPFFSGRLALLRLVFPDLDPLASAFYAGF